MTTREKISIGIDVEKGYELVDTANKDFFDQIIISEPANQNKSVAMIGDPATTTTHIPQDISWYDINFKIDERTILRDCYGVVPAGSVCAVMGPSGAGKTSLLNVLAGRSSSGHGITISGSVFVAGKKINPIQFRQRIAYVMQDDALMPTATPREALTFSAALRLPAERRSDLTALVNATLHDLGLEDCADILIGGALVKGISGGQRKRVSVGVEIITSPALLFLDEPTSGLDSFTARNLVGLLKSIASKNAAVLCTIHQPASDVFLAFDQCIFMKEGRIFYQGPTATMVHYFAQFDYHCPANYNPSDFIMYLAQTESMSTLEERGIFEENKKSEILIKEKLLIPSKKSPKQQLQLQQHHHLHDHNKDNDKDDTTDAVDNNRSHFDWSTSDAKIQRKPAIIAPVHTQIYWLSFREFRNIARDKTALAGRVGITVILNIVFGLIFLQAGKKDNADPNGFGSHFGALTMTTIASMFGSAQPIMLAFPYERPLFMREFSTGTYFATSYFLSKLCVELPLTFLQCLVQYTIAYNMIGLQGNFIFIVLAAFGLGAASCSVAVMMGCALRDVRDVTEMAPLLFVPQLLFAGFFIRTSQIPVFLRWAQYLCAVKYSINLILITEFDETNKSCQSSEGAMQACHNVLVKNDVEKSHWWVYVLVLFTLFAGFRLIAALILIKKAERYY